MSKFFLMDITKENYIKAIFKAQQQLGGKFVSTTALAERLRTKPSSISDMFKKLHRKKWVEYKAYKGVKLTDAGRQKALRIIRSHRLWELFLVNHLGFSWEEVHDLAERLEHISDEKLINALDKFLNYPKQDPHGEPIPDEMGKWRISGRKKLDETETGKTVDISGFKTDRPEFLQYLKKKNLLPGNRVKILYKDEDDQIMILEVEGKKQHISYANARKIYVYEI